MKILQILLATITFDTNKVDLFRAYITRWQFYETTPPDNKRERKDIILPIIHLVTVTTTKTKQHPYIIKNNPRIDSNTLI